MIGKFQHAGIVNRNRRIYPRNCFEAQLRGNSDFMRAIRGRKVLGHIEHPESGRTDLLKAAIVITDVTMKESGEVIGKLETLSTPHGKIASALFKDGVTVGISSRGRGSTITRDDGIDEVQDDYVMETFDLVADPSTYGAELELGESVKSLTEGTQKALTEAKEYSDEDMDKLTKEACQELLLDEAKALSQNPLKAFEVSVEGPKYGTDATMEALSRSGLHYTVTAINESGFVYLVDAKDKKALIEAVSNGARKAANEGVLSSELFRTVEGAFYGNDVQPKVEITESKELSPIKLTLESLKESFGANCDTTVDDLMNRLETTLTKLNTELGELNALDRPTKETVDSDASTETTVELSQEEVDEFHKDLKTSLGQIEAVEENKQLSVAQVSQHPRYGAALNHWLGMSVTKRAIALVKAGGVRAIKVGIDYLSDLAGEGDAGLLKALALVSIKNKNFETLLDLLAENLHESLIVVSNKEYRGRWPIRLSFEAKSELEAEKKTRAVTNLADRFGGKSFSLASWDEEANKVHINIKFIFQDSIDLFISKLRPLMAKYNDKLVVQESKNPSESIEEEVFFGDSRKDTTNVFSDNIHDVPQLISVLERNRTVVSAIQQSNDHISITFKKGTSPKARKDIIQSASEVIGTSFVESVSINHVDEGPTLQVSFDTAIEAGKFNVNFDGPCQKEFISDRVVALRFEDEFTPKDAVDAIHNYLKEADTEVEAFFIVECLQGDSKDTLEETKKLVLSKLVKPSGTTKFKLSTKPVEATTEQVQEGVSDNFTVLRVNVQLEEMPLAKREGLDVFRNGDDLQGIAGALQSKFVDEKLPFDDAYVFWGEGDSLVIEIEAPVGSSISKMNTAIKQVLDINSIEVTESLKSTKRELNETGTFSVVTSDTENETETNDYDVSAAEEESEPEVEQNFDVEEESDSEQDYDVGMDVEEEDDSDTAVTQAGLDADSDLENDPKADIEAEVDEGFVKNKPKGKLSDARKIRTAMVSTVKKHLKAQGLPNIEKHDERGDTVTYKAFDTDGGELEVKISIESASTGSKYVELWVGDDKIVKVRLSPWSHGRDNARFGNPDFDYASGGDNNHVEADGSMVNWKKLQPELVTFIKKKLTNTKVMFESAIEVQVAEGLADHIFDTIAATGVITQDEVYRSGKVDYGIAEWSIEEVVQGLVSRGYLTAEVDTFIPSGRWAEYRKLQVEESATIGMPSDEPVALDTASKLMVFSMAKRDADPKMKALAKDASDPSLTFWFNQANEGNRKTFIVQDNEAEAGLVAIREFRNGNNTRFVEHPAYMNVWVDKSTANEFNIPFSETAEKPEVLPETTASKRVFVNRAFAKHGAVTLPSLDRNYPPIAGMEGPFRFKSGKVYYYDSREGAYYDPDSDIYLGRNDVPESVDELKEVSKLLEREATVSSVNAIGIVNVDNVMTGDELADVFGGIISVISVEQHKINPIDPSARNHFPQGSWMVITYDPRITQKRANEITQGIIKAHGLSESVDLTETNIEQLTTRKKQDPQWVILDAVIADFRKGLFRTNDWAKYGKTDRANFIGAMAGYVIRQKQGHRIRWSYKAANNLTGKIYVTFSELDNEPRGLVPSEVERKYKSDIEAGSVAVDVVVMDARDFDLEAVTSAARSNGGDLVATELSPYRFIFKTNADASKFIDDIGLLIPDDAGNSIQIDESNSDTLKHFETENTRLKTEIEAFEAKFESLHKENEVLRILNNEMANLQYAQTLKEYQEEIFKKNPELKSFSEEFNRCETCQELDKLTEKMNNLCIQTLIESKNSIKAVGKEEDKKESLIETSKSLDGIPSPISVEDTDKMGLSFTEANTEKTQPELDTISRYARHKKRQQKED